MSNIVQKELIESIPREGKSTPCSQEGVIDHTSELSENIGSLYLNSDCSDVTFVVDGERCPAHRAILASRSEYFRALLCGGMRETVEKEIVFHDTTPEAFKILLRYIYTGVLPLGQLKEDMVLEVLELSHKYVFTQLQSAISAYLRTMVTKNNFCTIFNASLMYSMTDLINFCLNYGDQNSSDVLHSSAFLDLSSRALEELVSRNSFYAPELEIFEGIRRWIEVSPDRKDQCPKLTSLVRLALIPKISLLDIVRTSGLVSADEVLDAIAAQCCLKPENGVIPRGILRQNVNVASANYGATVLSGEVRGPFLNGELAPPIGADADSDQFTRHCFDDQTGITIALLSPHIINTIRIYLPDGDQCMYSYRLLVGISYHKEDNYHAKQKLHAANNLQWVELVNYSQYLCRSIQTITFPPQAISNIRIVGVANCTTYSKFYLAAIEALYSTVALNRGVKNGVPIPWDNVATVERQAAVIEGVSRSRNALLNGQTTDYDWDNGYTCHQIGSGSITVQFPQPYMISSMRMLLWDLDDRYYSYYVEVSVDQQTWKRVAERSQRQCRSWQIIKFEQTAVVFVRIVGTHNSANEVFHLVHLECPCRDDAPPLEENSVIPPIETSSSF